jgi:hypothetical protein
MSTCSLRGIKNALKLLKRFTYNNMPSFIKALFLKKELSVCIRITFVPLYVARKSKKLSLPAKVNKIQIDGISFIEKIDFEAFNESIRFKQSIYKSQSLTHIRVRIAGADAIYATNANRRFAKFNGIQTDFKPKGRKGKNYREQRQLRGMITKERASRLEGSFGKDKEHYHLRKIKAKGKENEILWIFFGIHVGNALEIGRRMSEFKSKSKSTSESQVA